MILELVVCGVYFFIFTLIFINTFNSIPIYLIIGSWFAHLFLGTLKRSLEFYYNFLRSPQASRNVFTVLYRSLGLEFEGAISEWATWGTMPLSPISPWPGVRHFPDEMGSLLHPLPPTPRRCVGPSGWNSTGFVPGARPRTPAPPPLIATAAD